jgi:hypothetical protein
VIGVAASSLEDDDGNGIRNGISDPPSSPQSHVNHRLVGEVSCSILRSVYKGASKLRQLNSIP